MLKLQYIFHIQVARIAEINAGTCWQGVGGFISNGLIEHNPMHNLPLCETAGCIIKFRCITTSHQSLNAGNLFIMHTW